jgi:hypothetical protein
VRDSPRLNCGDRCARVYFVCSKCVCAFKTKVMRLRCSMWFCLQAQSRVWRSRVKENSKRGKKVRRGSEI